MDSKRLKYTRDSSENVRNSILDRRATSLFKKVEEFSILCDVDVAIIIFRPGEAEPIVWKSQILAKEVLMRYLSFSKEIRLKKLEKLETYLSKKVNEQEERIRKLEKMKGEKEMELLFNQFMEGNNTNELDARQIKGLLNMFRAKMDKLNERKKQLNQPPKPPNFKPADKIVTPSASSTKDLINDPWGGRNTESAPIEGDDTNVEDDGHFKDLD
ncbi:MADS-box transcription factor PHERES 1-like [Lycium ferocissimum]|uniref:MADS-box transcription factor PHERES 1-like n=1 Tax=Lycium ferocissimum TaxID=112874 RepID=UPI0028166F3B|nr:MADS-box transcription factor PHERES 1-like [Lycium ferocissimum]